MSRMKMRPTNGTKDKKGKPVRTTSMDPVTPQCTSEMHGHKSIIFVHGQPQLLLYIHQNFVTKTQQRNINFTKKNNFKKKIVADQNGSFSKVENGSLFSPLGLHCGALQWASNLQRPTQWPFDVQAGCDCSEP